MAAPASRRRARAAVVVAGATCLALVCAGWAARVAGGRRAVLLEGVEVVPAADVQVLPDRMAAAAVAAQQPQFAVTGELHPVGMASKEQVQMLAPGPTQFAGDLHAESPAASAAAAEQSAAAAPAAPSASGVVGAALAAAGSAARQASVAVGIPMATLVAPEGASGLPGQTGGVGDPNRGPHASPDKARINSLVADEDKLMSSETHLAGRSKKIGAEVSLQGRKETALTAVVRQNRLAINDLTERLRRRKLIDEGQYGILYRRLNTVTERLAKVDMDEEEQKRAILGAQAALHQGSQMLAAGAPQAAPGPPEPRAPALTRQAPALQNGPYWQPQTSLGYVGDGRGVMEQRQKGLASDAQTHKMPLPTPTGHQLKADIDCAKAGFMCSNLNGGSSGGGASSWRGQNAWSAPQEMQDRHRVQALSRKERARKALVDMNPEELMSGYSLAGGNHPGVHLARARKDWFQAHLAKSHREAGSVIGQHYRNHALRKKR